MEPTQYNFVTKSTFFDDYFIVKYRSLFKECNPNKMGTKGLIVTKLNKFIQYKLDTTEYNLEKILSLILNATKLYLDKATDYTYIRQADYFISKDGGSTLDDFFEIAEEREQNQKVIDTKPNLKPIKLK